jgi:DNA-binding NtrC family response regulator
MTGEHDRALATLEMAANSPNISRLSRFSVSEGIARAYLGKGELKLCEEVLDRIEAAAAEDEELANSYGVRWAAITRARLLLQQQKHETAVEFLTRVEQRDRGATDAPFAAALSMYMAQALAMSGNSSDAARYLVLAHQLGATSLRGLQGQFYGALASILSYSHSGLSLSVRNRAVRVWHEQGTAWMQQQLVPATPTTSNSISIDAPVAINALASAIDLAHSPRLLAEELASVVKALGCATQVRTLVVRKDATVDSTSGWQALALGSVDDEAWHLECSLPTDPAGALTLSGVLRIGQAAVALQRFKAAERHSTALWPADQDPGQEGAVFISEEMRDLVQTATRISSTDIPILITGETGTGKEVLARLIHARSGRAKKVFMPFNCTTVPKEMMDSQLFGHRRGAFTGAVENFQGVIRSTRGGTLLLDEIGDLSLEAQPKLLRFLESGDVLPLGEANPVQTDVRVIAATNSDLDKAVSEGRFREDLYYRLNIVQLRLPPLRERRIEIPPLSRHYLQKFANQFKKGDLRLSDEAMEFLVLFDWPGNVRRLANEMRRLAVLSEQGAVLGPDDLSPEIARFRRTSPQQAFLVDSNQIVVRLDQPMGAAVQYVERAMLRCAMNTHQGRMEVVAKALGLSRKGLYLKRQRYGLA